MISRAAEIALEDSNGSVKAYFVVVHEPKRIPEKKRPPVPTYRGAVQFLAELLHHHPLARLTLISLTWDDDIWLTDGHEALVEAATSGSIELPSGRRASLRHYDRRGYEVWVRGVGQRGGHREAGPFGGSAEAVQALCETVWR